ncbi:MAG TPA: hypothetical protein VMB78_00175 [Dissulfurispiraceae bacterium]|nr:hypothetical protein [Dissulfurispiraceae bacterium]
MEEINELIRHYRLQEDDEYVIIPFTGTDGRKKRCFLLKRRFIRIVFSEGHLVDYPLTEAIEATIKYPDLRLSESIYLMHKEAAEREEEIEDDGPNGSMSQINAAQ